MIYTSLCYISAGYHRVLRHPAYPTPPGRSHTMPGSLDFANMVTVLLQVHLYIYPID